MLDEQTWTQKERKKKVERQKGEKGEGERDGKRNGKVNERGRERERERERKR